MFKNYEQGERMNEKIITVQCEGNCSETMEIKKVNWGDEIDYYIEFRTSTFYCGQSAWGIIKERIQFAWLALTKGNYIHQEILTNKQSLEMLRDELTKMFAD